MEGHNTIKKIISVAKASDDIAQIASVYDCESVNGIGGIIEFIRPSSSVSGVLVYDLVDDSVEVSFFGDFSKEGTISDEQLVPIGIGFMQNEDDNNPPHLLSSDGKKLYIPVDCFIQEIVRYAKCISPQ